RKQEISFAKNWLKKLDTNTIPRKLFDISFSRASGPGGQKVNKTSSKAIISLDQVTLEEQFPKFIPAIIYEQFIKSVEFKYFRPVNGGILIQSEDSRSRQENLENCFNKFITELKKIIKFEQDIDLDIKLKWENIEKRERLNKIKIKENRKVKKENRKKF
ncbi:hypothetical protein PACTADRAFT_29250, partial [Pachysolen tannophilus NRRL Y-2460]